MRLLVLHGPNLNRLGLREPAIYGARTLPELDGEIRAHAAARAIETEHRQSNHEGALLDALHEADGAFDGVIFNPGAYTHYSYALRDAIASLRVPVVEVHLSDIHAREPWRRVSVLAEVCLAQVAGRGAGSYLEAIDCLAAYLRGRSPGAP